MQATVKDIDYEQSRGKPMPSRNHAFLQSRLIKLLDRSYGDRYDVISELSIVVAGKQKVPDILIYEDFEFRPGNDELRVEEPPLGVIEILSPSQHLADLLQKSHLYFEAGIPSYWLVLPDLLTIYVFTAPNEYEVFVKTETLRDERLGIELSLAEVFR